MNIMMWIVSRTANCSRLSLSIGLGVVAIPAVMLAGFGANQACGADSSYTSEQFLKECKAGIQKLEQRSRTCKGSFRLIEGGLLPFKEVYDLRFAARDDQLFYYNYYVSRQQGQEPEVLKGYGGYRGVNDYYAFQITPLPEPDQYKLVAHEKVTSPHTGRIRLHMQHRLRPLYGTHWLDDLPVGPLLNHPTFKIIKLSDAVEDGRKVVSVDFTATPAAPETDERLKWPVGEVEGWFEVVPELSFAVSGFEYVTMVPGATPQVPPAKRRTRCEIKYRTTPDGLPMMVYYKCETAWLEMPFDGYFEAEDIDITYGKTLPAREFRLSHYNLPEPAGTPPLPPETPQYVWYLAGAGVLLLFAMVFRILGRRSRRVRPQLEGQT